MQSTTKQLSQNDMHAIRFAMAELFFGFARLNWVAGKKYGIAREEAMQLVSSFIETRRKNIKNPVAVYMYQIFLENKNKWAKMIMDSKKSNQPINCPPECIKKSQSDGINMVNRGLGKLSDKIQEFEPTSILTLNPLVANLFGHRYNKAM